LKINEDVFFFAVIDPHPVKYFAHHFGFYGAVEFSVEDSSEVYLDGLWNYPEDGPDSLMHNSTTIVISSLSRKWAIIANRDLEIGICGFSNESEMTVFKC
jgi:hypothetical protein